MKKVMLVMQLLTLYLIIPIMFMSCGAGKTSLTQYRSPSRSKSNNIFTAEKISTLNVGMSVTQIEYLFGEPDVKETKTFGEFSKELIIQGSHGNCGHIRLFRVSEPEMSYNHPS